ncbi:MAG TPA: universal stress protein [Allosphingosinicella sp.]
MKAILVDAREDPGFERRVDAALRLRSVFDGHLTCLHATPYDAFILGDPFGGVYALPTIIEDVRAAEERHRLSAEERLKHDTSSWTWVQENGQPIQQLIEHSRLADIVVLSLPVEEGRADPAMSQLAQVSLYAQSPVLAVPCARSAFDPAGVALVAWNGSAEAAHTIRFIRPLLEKASAVHIVTVNKDDMGWPASGAAAYLARYGIGAELHDWAGDGQDVADTLFRGAATLRPAYIAMGAYGHSRFREMMLGGVTRALLLRSAIPLILSH